MRDDLTRYSMLAVLLILLYFSYLVLRPFLTYLLFSLILVIVFRPLYQWIVNRMGHPRISSLLLVVLLILILVIPSFIIGSILVREAPEFYASIVTNIDLSALDALSERVGAPINPEADLAESVPRFQSYILENAGSFLTGATSLFIGLFIMFFSMFFLFTEGEALLKDLKRIIPLAQRHQDRLFKHINDVIHAIINGQVILGAIQGVLGGIIMLFLGVPYAILWGFIMVLSSTVPVLGSYFVWIPVSLWLLITGQVVQGVILLILGSLVIAQIDNFLRPYIVSRSADIHPVVVIVGVFGGIVAFGPAGFVTGPLVLAMLVTVLRFYTEELSKA